MATLKDIAKEAGVSVMSVSRVVNGQYSKVSEKNRKKIESIIEKYDYVPNLSARSLSSKSSKIIAIILREGGLGDNALQEPYNAFMVGCVCRIVQDKGYSPMLYTVSDYQEVSMRLRTWNVEGALFFGMFDHEMAELKEGNEIPMVFTDSYSKVRQISNVGLDDYKGGALAARHFIDNNHKIMAFAGFDITIDGVVKQRYQGYVDTIIGAGLGFTDAQVIRSDSIKEQMKKNKKSKNPITAIFATSDIHAMKIMEILTELEIDIPNDCSIIGFDNLYFTSFSSPKLTTISQDIEKKAEIAMDILLRHIENPDSPSESVTLDVCLVKRNSVANLL